MLATYTVAVNRCAVLYRNLEGGFFIFSEISKMFYSGKQYVMV